MIEELRITSLGVIEESVLELGSGLTVITGETGAGKTMLVTALGLLLGQRADSGAVRTGAKSARVEGTVTTDASLRTRADDLGASLDDDRLLLARQVYAEGRSRAFVGGASVPVASLSDLSADLVAVHGQSDQHGLLQAEAQREILDAYAGTEVVNLLAIWTQHYLRLRAVERELREMTASLRERAREADVLRLGLEEIAAVAPQPGEDEALASEESRLGHADTLRTSAQSAREALSAELEGPDALGAVAAARGALEGAAEHDPLAKELAARAAEVGYLLTDLATDVASYASNLEADPARLAAVSERRAALATLTRKYADTIDGVLAWSQDAAGRLTDLDNSDDQVAELEATREQLRKHLADTGRELTRHRRSAADQLAAAATQELTGLAMPHARLSVAVTQHEEAGGLDVDGATLRFGPHGLDDIEILLAANTGADPRPLGKGASGGELSRVMLALEVVLAGNNPVPTFVFDEVDAGVGGKAAVEIGRCLAALAKSAQVLVVTHLPQVAAFADHHVVVRKSSDGLVTTSGLTTLTQDERVQELSRMLAGLEASDTALAHAGELLDMARKSWTTATSGSKRSKPMKT